MAELTFKSPGVSTREIDLSGPTAIQPRGIPAGIIGTAVRGPAFVPVTFATFQDFVSTFGNTDGAKFGPLAVNEWMRNAGAGTYVRVLGVGNGKQRGSTDGVVTNSGFTVGERITQADGNIGENPYTGDNAGSGASGSLGRTYVLGCFMSESAGSTFFSSAGFAAVSVTDAHPIIRGVLMAPSGVVPALSCSQVANNTAPTHKASNIFGPTDGINNAGANFGDVVTGSAKQEFTVILNGHKTSDAYPNVITASFDPAVPNYFANVMNTDPTKTEEAGHFLYARYDIDAALAEVTGSGLGPSGGLPKDTNDTKSVLAFLLTSSMDRASSAVTDASNVGVPDWESYTERFTHAESPWVISQVFGGKNKRLFKVHSRDDGAVGNSAFKVTIENVQASTNENYEYGTFDLLVRKFDDSDDSPIVLQSFRGLDLNPASDRYVARVIGNTNTFYDFDKKAGGQKLVIEGAYANASQYIRIEEGTDLRLSRLDKTALPCGFRGLPHLVTSGTFTNGTTTAPALTGSFATETNANTVGITTDQISRVSQPPAPMRENVSVGISPKARANASLTWGIQFEKKTSLTDTNKNQALDPTLTSLTKYFPDWHTSKQNLLVKDNAGTADVDGTVLDVDRFCNNLFTLERVEIITGSDNKPNAQQWSSAKYRRDGVQVGSLTDRDGNTGVGSRFLDPSLDFAHLPTRKWLKFTFPLQGGFDGLNIFNEDQHKMLDNSARREMDDPLAAGVNSSTIAAYRKAIDVMEEKSDVDIQILAIPGLRHEAVTDYAMESTERRFDALFVMDIEEKDTYNSYVTSSATQITNVTNTVNRFANRGLDSSFAAAYFPDVVITDPSTKSNVQCPPTVGVIGALSLNDAVAHPWFAPAGFTRGAMASVLESQVKLNRTNLDELYTVDVNPLTSFPHTPGVVVFGQKTLLAAQSALDRVNVRRLLIDIRRKVRRVANGLLFEPNREETLNRFSSAVQPILIQIQQQQGLDRFKVQIDTSTTTQADVENNTIRGKIFLQPTRAVEFISLDFVVTNAGAEV